jgi:hypothetical protein
MESFQAETVLYPKITLKHRQKPVITKTETALDLADMPKLRSYRNLQHQRSLQLSALMITAAQTL